MKCLVKLWLRPTRKKGLYIYYLRWTSVDGKEKYQSLGHNDKRKAEQQRREKQAQLTNAYVEPSKMRLSELLEDGAADKAIIQQVRVLPYQLPDSGM
jgi:hypothetical protein